MERKIKNYVDNLFLDIPKSKKATKMKHELAVKMAQRQQDYLDEGMTSAQAFSMTIASFAEVDDILEEAMQEDIDENKKNYFGDDYIPGYAKLTAQLESIAAMIFILGPIVLVVCALINMTMVGIILISIILLASCLLSIYIGTLKTHYNPKIKNDPNGFFTNNRVRNKILFALTVLIGIIYVLGGLFSGIWHPSWIIFFIVPLLKELLYTMAEFASLKKEVDENEK